MNGSLKSRPLREEAGFTLVEMMVTIMVMMAVFFALHSIFDTSIRVFSFGNDKVEAVENARLGLERMEREIQAAYPVDKISEPPDLKDYLFFSPGSPATPTRPGAKTITFGNDLRQGVIPPNRRIYNSATGTIDPKEEITYKLDASCPVSGTSGVCKLQRITSSGSSTVVENVVPDDDQTAASSDGLSFTYLKRDLNVATAADGTDIAVVRVKLKINVDGRIQTLTTDVGLRNRGV